MTYDELADAYDDDYCRGWDDGVEGYAMINDPTEAYYDGYSAARVYGDTRTAS